MPGEAEADKPLLIQVFRHLLQHLDPLVVDFNQVVIGGEDGGPADLESAEEEFAGKESVEEIRERLKNALSDVSDVIDNAEAATDTKLTSEELVQLKNRIAALEKEIINLGATVSK